ncbi:ABC-type antimicrobial peptide transport system, permease component [Bacillus sp. OxB-1]|nr:ABC-type antimicrobial peptide transport system, permease component [Bacillus sp. OxB-1]
MTLFDLVIRSMRKNIKHYYLYFFALIFSVSLYFVFATLQHDPAVVAQSGGKMGTSFKVAGILLLVIAGIFVVYANAIFLKRRSREIGLYQLIGLTKGSVVRLLIIENTLLSAGALAIGIGAGILVSRLFLLLLMKLVGFDGFIELTFSVTAVIQTAVVFLAITVLTSVQMLSAVYRNSLLGLFNAEKKGEHPKEPKTIRSAALALIGVGLVIFGYWLSGRMLNEMLFFNMLAVLATTILGTYLIFRIAIGWLFHQIRAHKQGHLGLYDSLSVASLMHRMRGNANSLTIITVLSAMTLAMLAGAYSLFYSTEKETRYTMPFDFMFEGGSSSWSDAEDVSVEDFEAGLKAQGIEYTTAKIELLSVAGRFEKGVFPDFWGPMEKIYANFVNAKQLQQAGLPVETPEEGMIFFHSAETRPIAKDIRFPFEVYVTSVEGDRTFTVEKYGEGNVVNNSFGYQFVVNETDFDTYKRTMPTESEVREVQVFNIVDKEQLVEASAIRNQKRQEGTWSRGVDYYTMYKNAIESNGLLIFIAGFLGLVFLISTGSILYFKQMTEAEQERKSYATLRQLGFTVQEIMHGIIRKQAFVFGLPLLIGLLHSVFAIKAASFLFMSDITFPAAIAMGLYMLIYMIFALLTVGYYRKTVKGAL